MGGADETWGAHPGDERLVAFAVHELSPDEAAAVAAHLGQCSRCAGMAARMRLVGEVMRTPDAAPPAALAARAKMLFGPVAAQQRTPRSDLLEPLRRIVAQLVFDSGAGIAPAMAGFRGGGDRHLTYVAYQVQIDLRVQPPTDQAGAWRVQGQVDADLPGAEVGVDLVPAGEEQAVAHTATDEHGVFSLSAPPGRYDIRVRLPDALQVLPGVELG